MLRTGENSSYNDLHDLLHRYHGLEAGTLVTRKKKFCTLHSSAPFTYIEFNVHSELVLSRRSLSSFSLFSSMLKVPITWTRRHNTCLDSFRKKSFSLYQDFNFNLQRRAIYQRLLQTNRFPQLSNIQIYQNLKVEPFSS